MTLLCIYIGCKKRSTYNYEEEKPMYCLEHKKNGMVDVRHKKCIHLNCKKRSTYNNITEKAMYCLEHKKDGMVDVRHKTCIHVDCKIRPSYNNEGKSPIYCLEHKKDGMINVRSKTCNTYLCSTAVKTNKYNGYCLFCYVNMFPDKPVSRNYKTKEYSITEYVKSKYPTLSWITDKKVSDGCSKRRPDLLLDLGYQIVIVEIDENQHIDYDCSCENKRIMELSQDVGYRPIIFIRFNPDDYEDNGKYITSCWCINKQGICVIKKAKKDEWNNRLKTLEKTINYWIDPINQTNKMVETIQLFFDSIYGS